MAASGESHHEWQRTRQDIIRLANIADVVEIDEKLEWDQRAIFTTIQSVAAQIEQQKQLAAV